MDEERFDALARTLADGVSSRRRVLRMLMGGGFGLALNRINPTDTASKELETARKGCRKERRDCRRDNQCCSGSCVRGTCRRAPGQGTCTVEKDSCRAGRTLQCNTNPDCACVVTARGASFCGNSEESMCAPCTNNADCAEVTGVGSVCVRTGGDFCCGDLGSACIRPCGAGTARAQRDGTSSVFPTTPEART